MQIERILEMIQSEMKPGMGCTEPAAIGLAVSNTCVYMDGEVNSIRLRLSSSIFKNAFCVKLPGIDKAGVPLAAAIGYLLAKPGNTMEIFAKIDNELVKSAEKLLTHGFVDIEVENSARFMIEVEVKGDTGTVRTLTLDSHDNLVYVQKDGKVLFDMQTAEQLENADDLDITQMTIKQLVELSENGDIQKIQFLRKAVEMNTAMSEEGLSADYGLGIGLGMLNMVRNGILADDLVNRVKIATSAASDCRMGGGQISAMTVLGSGNQGFGATLATATVAREIEAGEEKMLRAVMMTILIAMHMKYQVGRLSPICGLQLTGASSAAAITWLLGGGIGQIEGAIQNMLGGVAGMVCDGAKDGCALKLSACSGEAVLCARMSLAGIVIQPTDGLVCGNVEDTIRNMATFSRQGMAPVDNSIIDMLLHKPLPKTVSASV